MHAHIYLDESGDLGWNFNLGSSCFLTLAAIIIPAHLSHHLERLVRGIYKSRKRCLKNELKSVELSSIERQNFVNALVKLNEKHREIYFKSITVNKKKVNDSFRKNPNGLYNYMTKLLLVESMTSYKIIDFLPDSRSIKTSYKHALHQYLEQMLLEQTIIKADTANTYPTILNTTPYDSKNHLGIQAADILASLCWAKHEHNNLTIDALTCCTHKKLFFC
ncbi:DUF3800 domain-containing protein [Hydromonas duriensis]|uniref:Uncharacterized protein DUF3800 n=1 Tax=Hydromonas duriensis TaxID=1527608 RepID=A0A4R6YAR1_9BURK|nr:DUF3800 domain-containing protein [Hydromonas duriensis]TDR32604.1 uncharacterized protein DUF3800 [Hydromonas duriensis]